MIDKFKFPSLLSNNSSPYRILAKLNFDQASIGENGHSSDPGIDLQQ